MFGSIRDRAVRLWVGIAFLLATVATGFAHAPLNFGDNAPVDLSAYVLPDGSLPTLCLGNGSEETGHEFARSVCDACRLTTAPGLVVRSCETGGIAAAFTVIRIAVRSDRRAPGRSVIRPSQRAPPAQLLA